MAGHRRIAGAAAGRTEVVSKVMVSRSERIREEARRRYALARTARERFVAAFDYVRSGEAACFRAGVPDLDVLIDEANRDLMSMGDELAAALAKRGRAE